MAFTVSGCGDTSANGEYRSVQRTKNGARVYMRPNGFVLSREIIAGRAGWIIGRDQVSRPLFRFTFANLYYFLTIFAPLLLEFQP